MPGEGELVCGWAVGESIKDKASVSCRREEKKPISTSALQRTRRERKIKRESKLEVISPSPIQLPETSGASFGTRKLAAC